MPELLDGRRILVLEDEYLVALDMKQMIEDWGGTVVGPVGRLAQAFALAESEELDGALLDVCLKGDLSFAVADELIAKGVPVIFVTGYDTPMLPERFATTPRLAKPFSEIAGERMMRKVFARD